MRHVTHDMLHVKRDTAHMKPNFFSLLSFLSFTELPLRVIQSRNRDVPLSVCLFVSKVLIGDYAQRVGVLVVHYNINNVLKHLIQNKKPYYICFKKSKVRLINYKKIFLGTLMKDIGH